MLITLLVVITILLCLPQALRTWVLGKLLRAGIAFKCVQCEYRVTTLDFQSKDGNTRTQAATAVNEHAVSVHHQPMLISSPQRRA
jgi:hypothetical protein